MEFAYLDESGDPGAKGSKHLVLTLMCTHRKQDIIKIIRNLKHRLLEKNKTANWLNRAGGEIKSYGFPDETLLMHTLDKLAQIESKVYFLDLDKGNASVDNAFKPNILGDLFKHILIDNKGRVPEKIVADIDFFNDEKNNYFVLQEFKTFRVKVNDGKGQEQKGEMAAIHFNHISEEDYKKSKEDKNKVLIKIEHQNSKLNEELQALDLISGSIFCKVEHGDSSYFDKLLHKKMKIDGNAFVQKQK